MKHWQNFELSTQRLYAALLSDTRQRELFVQTNKFHETLFFDLASRIVTTDNFLEVGAYEGSTSKRIAARCPQTQCAAFEADPDIYAKFRQENVENNTLRNYAYLHRAVSERPGTLDFHKQTESAIALAAELLPNNSLRTKPSVPSRVVKVPATTVDDYLEGRGGTSILRIDVEGLAYEVLKGAEKSLPYTRMIYAEVEDYQVWEGQKTVFDIYELLEPHGFIPITRDIQTPGQYNVLFLPEELAFRRDVRAHVSLYCRRLAALNTKSQNSLGT